MATSAKARHARLERRRARRGYRLSQRNAERQAKRRLKQIEAGVASFGDFYDLVKKANAVRAKREDEIRDSRPREYPSRSLTKRELELVAVEDPDTKETVNRWRPRKKNLRRDKLRGMLPRRKRARRA